MTTKKELMFNLEEFCEFPFPNEEAWKTKAEESLKGRALDTLKTNTYEGIELKPLYLKKDVENLTHVHDLPGEGSFVRGTDPIHTGGNAWEIAQEITGMSPKAFNEAILSDLQRGQTMVNLVADEATKRGYDADQADDKFVGLNGIPLSTIADLEEALQNVDLEQNQLFMQTGISTLPLFASVIALMKKNNQKIDKLQALIGLDPIGSVVSSGHSQLGMKRLYNTMADLIKWSNENAPSVKTIYVQGEVYHNAGASATEELAYAIATGVQYISEMIDRGLEIDEIANHIYFSFAVGSNVFMEIAKLRAARLLWSKIIASFGGNKQSQKMYIHARTSSWTKTVYDPYVNMLRTTTEAFAGAVGGADSMHISSFDEAIRPADTFSRRIARNTQIILQEESYLNQMVDPAGGSWYVEALTDAVAEKSWLLFQQVEENSGMFEALRAGFVQQQISETTMKKKSNTEQRKDRIVGTNMYPNLEEKSLEVSDTTEELKSSRVEKMKIVKQTSRDELATVLAKIKPALQKDEQIVPLFIEAAAKGATIGEMIETLAVSCIGGRCKGVEVEKLVSYRRAESFEQLRQAAEKYKNEYGYFPKVFSINLGPISKHKARADFASGFFAAGGIETTKNNGFSTADEAIEATLQSNLDVAIICGTDEQYAEYVATIAKGLKREHPTMYIMLAGKPPIEIGQEYLKAGVDELVHLRSNCYETNVRLLERKGVL